MKLAYLETWNEKVYNGVIYINGEKIDDENVIKKAKAWKLVKDDIFKKAIYYKNVHSKSVETDEKCSEITRRSGKLAYDFLKISQMDLDILLHNSKTIESGIGIRIVEDIILNKPENHYAMGISLLNNH